MVTVSPHSVERTTQDAWPLCVPIGASAWCKNQSLSHRRESDETRGCNCSRSRRPVVLSTSSSLIIPHGLIDRCRIREIGEWLLLLVAALPPLSAEENQEPPPGEFTDQDEDELRPGEVFVEIDVHSRHSFRRHRRQRTIPSKVAGLAISGPTRQSEQIMFNCPSAAVGTT